MMTQVSSSVADVFLLFYCGCLEFTNICAGEKPRSLTRKLRVGIICDVGNPRS